jgi:hypothetical protein
MTAPARTVQEFTTNLSGDEVLKRAKTFFSTRPSIYSAFIDKEGPGFCSFRGQGGEELVIAATTPAGGGSTLVTGSTYMFDAQVSRFFSTLPPAAEVAA